MSSGTELAKAYVQIVPSAKGMGNSITSMLNGEAGSAGDSAGETLGSNLIGKLKGIIAAAGIGTFIKESLEAGGALQQSFGGLETLYGEASDAMKEYAEAAAEVGISANSYAEQATSFGASLKQAFGGDVTAAADAANQAIIDMADNSSKFGTDIESIQTAYQGFSKQNYTMLDNLKLGYGGTKTEMERLLADAEKLSGQTYSIDNLGDVYEAIHVIQQDLGVTGNAAAEASQTFTGSFDAMKASATNLMAALSSGEMNVGPQMQSLVSSASSFLFNNLIPMVISIGMQLPEALVTGVQTALPILEEQASALIDNVMTFLNDGGAEKMINSGVEMITNMGTGLIQSLPSLIDKAGTIVSGLLNAILKNVPTLMKGAYQMVTTLAKGIINNLPQIAASAGKLIAKLAQSLLQNLPAIISTGFQIITKLVTGIINALPKLPSAAKQVISSFKNAFNGIDWKTLGKNIISGIVKGLTGSASAIASAAKTAAKNALNAAKNLLGIHSPSRVFRDQVGKMVALGMAEGITDNSYAVTDAVNDMADLGADSALSTIHAAYSGNRQNTSPIGEVLALLNQYLPGLADQQIVLDTGVVAGAVNKSLQTTYTRQVRGMA